MTLRQTWSRALAAALFLPLLLLSGCKKKADEPAPKPVAYVEAAHPEVGPIAEEIQADAILAPLAQAAISPKIVAPVRRFLVERGARVRAGQMLAVLENRDLKAAALDNRGAYAAAKGSYETATRATVPEETTKAQLDLREAQATLDLNRKIVASRSDLVAQGAIPGRDLDTARAALIQAQGAVDLAAQRLTATQKYSTQAALETAKGQLTSAEGKYLGAEAQVNYTEIRSPINGVVTDRPYFAGETPAAGAALITVMETSAMLAKLHIAQRQAQQIALGNEATLAVAGIADPIPAKVSFISPALDAGSTTVEVWLRVANPTGALKAGTPVRATILGRRLPGALLIPTSAIEVAADGSGKTVLVIGADGAAHRKIVQVGIQTAETTEVLSGISTADEVITSGGHGLDDGTPVKLGAAPVEDAPGAGAGKSAAKDGDDK